MTSTPDATPTSFPLGRFEVDLAGRELLENGASVRLGARAFAILEMLVAADGRLVTKDALLDAIWPDTFVEENTLQVHLSALRRALGEERNCIMTVPGRGYRLVRRAAAEPPRAAAHRAAPAGGASHATRLPRHPDVIGRVQAVAAVREALDRTRVLTLTGAGGIGKTTLSVTVANAIEAEAPGSVHLVELASMHGAAEIVAAVEGGLGLRLPHPASAGGPPTTTTAPPPAGAPRLLLLDNAEHLVVEVARVVECLLAAVPALRILVTSREPLRIAAEAVFAVEPLDVPERDADDTAILQRSAVQLFLARVQAMRGGLHGHGGGHGGGAAELRLIGEICRRLDGIPLAIELAAARVVSFGVDGVHQRLSDRLSLLSGGFRTALPRHQTLRAAFDWSFALLDAESRALFRRLAPFGGAFSLEAMCAVACDRELTVRAVVDGIGELVAKSLVGVEFDGPVARYRLSESTRAYALEQLRAAGEAQALAARHARYLASLFRGDDAASGFSGVDDEPDMRQALADARGAVDWAFSPDGDTLLGVELSATLVVSLLENAQIEECGRRAAQAVAALEALPAGSIAPVDEVRLKLALAAVLPNLTGPIQRAEDLWFEVHAHAERTGNDALLARAFWGLWNVMLSAGKVHEALHYSRRFERFARETGCVPQHVLATQLTAVAEHCRGDHEIARAKLEQGLRHMETHPEDVESIRRFAVDPRAIAYSGLARIHWLRGDTDEAARLTSLALGLIPAETMEPWFTHVLGVVAVPLALISDDRVRAAHYLSIMKSQASLHRLTIWGEFGDCLAGILAIRESGPEASLPQLESSLDSLQARGFRRLTTPLVIECALALIAAGRVDDALARLHDAQASCEKHGELYFMPELLRALGVAAQAQAAALPADSPERARGTARALACFSDAIAMARSQGARMWELRAALGLARLPRSPAEMADARDALHALAPHFDRRSSVPEIRELHAGLPAGA
ncbi:ATP-binding protein [Burkholderia plantarii]|uniref:ATP-binding protein n=1 Tax=Burkholderia plantarii TaxID=41899 RepID=UPI000870B6C2|nr:winged helix-turn-helix domain-containing protein [Burkholderia plantarii]